MPIVIVEFGNTVRCRFPNVWIGVFEEDLYQWYGCLDVFSNVNIRHCSQRQGSYERVRVFHILQKLVIEKLVLGSSYMFEDGYSLDCDFGP